MIKRVQRWKHFPYAERAAEAVAAWDEVGRTAAAARRRDDRSDPATIAWFEAVRRYDAAWDAAFPPGFWEEFDKLKAGSPAALEAALAFLEADPWFDRSGYVKEDLIRLINRLPYLAAGHVERLRQVVLKVVDRHHDAREFRRYCRLACRVDDVDLDLQLRRRLDAPDEGVRRRAGWVLAALERSRAQARAKAHAARPGAVSGPTSPRDAGAWSGPISSSPPDDGAGA